MAIRIDGTNTTANPGITGADADTGLQFGTDEVKIVTGGTDAVTVDASQRVGIGTNAPTAQLEIGGIPSSGSAEDAFTISRSDGTQLFNVNYNSGNNTVGISGNNKAFAFTNKSAFGESLRIDSSGRLFVGTSSALRNDYWGSGTVQVAEDDGAARIQAYSYKSSGAWASVLELHHARGTLASPSTLVANDRIGEINFYGYNSAATDPFQRAASIHAFVDGTPSSSGDTTDMPGALAFSTSSDGASSPTERMRIDSQGRVYVKDSIILETVGERLFFNNSTAASIGSSSSGASTTTLYIGNAAIQVSSDIRLKENIEDTNLDALNAISRINVKDFTWNDPTDTSPNNRNARGKWTGLIAQELVEVLPFVVNAPRKEEDGSIDYESEDRWTLDQSQLCPVLIKAIQQQQEIIAGLEARIAALEGGQP